jgi:putative membrane protein
MKNALLLYAKGIAMGAADVVPGVSGGTVAFITGIYDELLRSIGAVPNALGPLLRGRVAEAWRIANANFLLILFAGILTSVLSLAKLITYLLEQHPIPVWSFFFGLILVSVHLVSKEIQQRSLSRLASLCLGIGFAYWITVAAPVQWSSSSISLFFAGAIAICAMILPGISGSFILVLLGLYPVVLGAVKALDIGVMLVFAAGCLVGLLSFARLLSWVLQRWRDLMLAFLTGLMLGSLNKVWPWKETLTWRIDSHGARVPLLEQNLLPGTYGDLSGQDPQLLLAILLAVAGIILVLGLEWFAGRRQPLAETV